MSNCSNALVSATILVTKGMPIKVCTLSERSVLSFATIGSANSSNLLLSFSPTSQNFSKNSTCSFSLNGFNSNDFTLRCFSSSSRTCVLPLMTILMLLLRLKTSMTFRIRFLFFSGNSSKASKNMTICVCEFSINNSTFSAESSDLKTFVFKISGNVSISGTSCRKWLR
uniref:(northern house mosquito) hypothetical protein n=1 Tax=Culex pipiens TaxID=7175 RepID=A0A8D8G296_CULPI